MRVWPLQRETLQLACGPEPRRYYASANLRVSEIGAALGELLELLQRERVDGPHQAELALELTHPCRGRHAVGEQRTLGPHGDVEFARKLQLIHDVAVVNSAGWPLEAETIATWPDRFEELATKYGLIFDRAAYKQAEWVNVSRTKFDGLVGHDLIWCLYCDWRWSDGCYGRGRRCFYNRQWSHCHHDSYSLNLRLKFFNHFFNKIS